MQRIILLQIKCYPQAVVQPKAGLTGIDDVMPWRWVAAVALRVLFGWDFLVVVLRAAARESAQRADVYETERQQLQDTGT